MKLWREKVGGHGLRVYVFERKPGGNLYYEVYAKGRRVSAQRSLRHVNKERALDYAERLRAQLVLHHDSRGPLSLQVLIDKYEESAAFRAKKERTQAEDRARLERVLGFLGGEREVRSLTPEDVERYRQARMRGEVSGKRVGARAVAADLSTLRAALNWATRERNAQGRPLLDRNPLYGARLPVEKNPKRGAETFDNYLKLMEVAGEVDWRLPLALTVAEAMGRRLSSILHLRRADVDLDRLPYGWLRFDAAFDKTGREAWVPLTEHARRVLREHLGQLPDNVEWLFPSEVKPEQPVDRSTMDRRLRKAYKHAGLESLPGKLWHAWRSKFATERKHLPGVDVAKAGGWKSTETLVRCYQQTDEAAVVSVILNGRSDSYSIPTPRNVKTQSGRGAVR